MNKAPFKIELNKIADVTAGQSPESKYYSFKEGIPFLQGNRTFGNLYPSIEVFTKKVTKWAYKNEVLLSVRAPVGDLNFAPFDLCIGRGLASLKAKNGNNKFLYYALKYNIKNLLRQGIGTTFESVNINTINNFELIIPELESDRSKIASFLSSIDSKFELNNFINTELEAMAKTIYDYWFVQFDFPDENGKPYKTSGGKMVWNEELKRDIPEGWGVGKLRDFTNIFDSKRIPLSNVQRSNMKGIYPYYGATEIMDYINDYIFDGEYVLIAEDGSVMDEKGYPFVQFIWGKTWVNNHAHILQAKNINNNEFLYFFLKTISVLQIMTGSIQKKITQDNLLNVVLVLPNDNLLKIYSKIVIPIRKRRMVLKEENKQLTSLRDWLLPMLMNGQVKVK
ncbi:MAG TPA: restriction endonuclease subunit S [Ignavibacteria bacterium]|nr:restriction endonuclease subunit S [Ignavibacteria bacterium]HRK00725.1 restriction endonuclease subunit S [Ignavibacteria bacterium]